jgi:hypothetical protein
MVYTCPFSKCEFKCEEGGVCPKHNLKLVFTVEKDLGWHYSYPLRKYKPGSPTKFDKFWVKKLNPYKPKSLKSMLRKKDSAT